MTKQQLREAISSIIKTELNEALLLSPIQIAYTRGYTDGREGKPADVSSVKDLDDFIASTKGLDENAPAKPAPTKEPAVAPGKPAEKKPRRHIGNPNVKPAPKAKATMKEAEMLKQVIKRFKSKK